ncbi:MAG: mechanosensitive ion channel, partial [Gammaproteobacteria bacterium]|nr:mechanosensitive ion channel [Gammaproteobacteria bacterium]
MELITQSFRFELRIAAVVGVLLALFLLAMRPEDRASTRNALLLVLLCTIAELFSSLYADDASSRVARIASFAAGFGMGIALIRLASILVFRLLFPAMRFKVVNLVEDLVFAALLLVWGFAWLSIVGVDLASLVTTSAVITGVIAFSMQDTLGNILGGIVLQLEQSVKVKDWVQIDDIRGQVTDVRWRYTEIVTRNHETVYVPNSYLMKNRFMVMGARADPGMRWRRWVWFNLDFSLPPLEVCEILVRSIRDAEIDRVAHDPAPTAVLMDVTEGCARYALRYFLNDARSDDPTDSIVRAHALAALERAGVRLAVRREERTVLREDEERAAAKAKVEHEQRVRALASLPMFAPLSDEEKSEVADHLIHAPFV